MSGSNVSSPLVRKPTVGAPVAACNAGTATDMIVVGVADQDERDLPAGVAHDRFHMLRVLFGAGVQHRQSLWRFNKIGVGAEIGHRAGIGWQQSG